MRSHACLVLGLPVDIELIELAAPAGDSPELERWAFLLGERVHLVSQVLDGWEADGHTYVHVRVQDGRTFMLREDAGTQRWTASGLVREKHPGHEPAEPPLEPVPPELPPYEPAPGEPEEPPQ